MWEAIAQNKRRSWVLFSLLLLLLLSLGAALGQVFDHYMLAINDELTGQLDGPIQGWHLGIALALIIWVVQMLAAFFAGESLLLKSVGAKRIGPDDMPMLWNVVEEMKIAATLPAMPDIYLIYDLSPNAFAIGRKPERSAVAVTTGLLARVNRDELQGVIAHEIGHIKNLDVRFMTQAATVVGSVVILSDIAIRMLMAEGHANRRRTSGKGGGQIAVIFIVVAFLMAILAPFLARLLYFACSRKREYLADASAARFTRYPLGLASALHKISKGSRRGMMRNTHQSRMLAPMFIINPFAIGGGSTIFSTHPPTEQRIRILRKMAGAGYGDYETAFREVRGGRCLGEVTLSQADGASVREPSEDQSVVGIRREGTDFLDRLSDMLFIQCGCGVRIKVPPKTTRKRIPCLHCGKLHDVPAAEVIAAGGVLDLAISHGGQAANSGVRGAVESTPSQQVYRRTGQGWDSFKCNCGNVIQISPGFCSPDIKCRKCHAMILVK